MFTFNPELLTTKIDYKKQTFTAYYGNEELYFLDKSNRFVFAWMDCVIKFDNPFFNHFYSNQCRLEKYTWDLVCEKYPNLKPYFTAINYFGEYTKGKHFIVSERVNTEGCHNDNEEIEYLLDPFDFNSCEYDGYQVGMRHNGEYVLYDYAINNFSMKMVNLGEL